MALFITRRRMMAAVATSAALLSAVPARAGSDAEELTAKKDRLVDLASNLAHQLYSPFGSLNDGALRPWIDGSGYKQLVSFTVETERLAQAMVDNRETAETGERLKQLGRGLRKNVTILGEADMLPIHYAPAREILKEIYAILTRFEKI